MLQFWVNIHFDFRPCVSRLITLRKFLAARISCAPFITQLVEVLNSIGYYIETTVEPGGCTTLTIHVARQPPQVLTRLEEI